MSLEIPNSLFLDDGHFQLGTFLGDYIDEQSKQWSKSKYLLVGGNSIKLWYIWWILVFLIWKSIPVIRENKSRLYIVCTVTVTTMLQNQWWSLSSCSHSRCQAQADAPVGLREKKIGQENSNYRERMGIQVIFYLFYISLFSAVIM